MSNQSKFNLLFRQDRIKTKSKNKKGDVALVFAITILIVVLIIGLAMGEWIVASFKISNEARFSAPAYYAADAGIERLFFDVVANGGPQNQPDVSASCDAANAYFSGNIPDSGNVYPNDPFYFVCINSTTSFQAKSVGVMQLANGEEIKRSIEINWDVSW
ncbi:MAG: hypothetical protein V1698_02545 [bacterium]